MRTNYVLIDYENVQPKDIALLTGHPFIVRVFAGANQTKVPLDLARALQPLGANADYILSAGHGRNALDFHIAFYLGELADKDPEGFFHIISKDAGFDPLLVHLKARGVRVQRSATLREMPILAIGEIKGVDERVEGVDERVEEVVKNLASRGNARPRRVKTLASTINAHFMKKLEPEEIDELIAALEKRGEIVVQDGKVGYPKPRAPSD